jgi:hypothetical protein
MTWSRSKLSCRACCGGASLMIVCLLSTVANTGEVASKPTEVNGNIDFDFPDAPSAKFEFDVGQGMFQDLFGMGEAAVAGLVEGLTQATAANADVDEVKATTEGLAAAQQVVQLIGKFVQGARINGYELEGSKTDVAKTFEAYYSKKLRSQNWQTIFRMRDGDETYAVSTLRSEGAIKGVFIFSADGDEVYLVNIVCDVSPENVKKLTSAAARMGVKVSANQSMLEDGMHMLKLSFQAPGE